MKKRFLMVAGAALTMVSPAMANGSGPMEVGYVRGSLALPEMADGQLNRAEQILAAQSAEDAQDPARLINLGVVYVRLGRLSDAHAAFAAAQRSEDVTLILSDGRERSSRDIAREKLTQLGAYAVASR